MSLTTHPGYGPLQLADFAPGDLFARYDGALARVCDPQPVGRPDHIFVWTNFGSNNAERVWLHNNTAFAYAITEERSWTIERRRNGG